MAATYLLFLLALLCTRCMQLHLCAADDHPPTVRCSESERQALLGFMHGLRDPSNRLSSWTGRDCCRWAGVGCDGITSHVVRLDLHNPQQMYNTSLEGEISPSLLGLQHLTYLNLSRNSMIWSHNPRFMGSFKSLRYLDLSNSGLCGLVPHELGNISNLRYLDLSFDGTDNCQHEVGDDVGWLARLTSLRHLAMDNVNFSKASNWLQALNTLPSLREISLYSCDLQRVRLSLHPLNFTSLTRLELSNNADLFGDMTDLKEGVPRRVRNSLKMLGLSSTGLTGRIPPEWLGDFKHLRSLYLDGNSLHGPMPASLGTLSSLVNLDISNNFLEGVLSEKHFSNLTKLELLTISHNPSLVLDVSPAWVPPFRLKYILLGSCKLGPSRPRFPAWLRTQESCTILSMSNCSILDRMPGWFWNFSAHIMMVNLSHNEINGQLPPLASNGTLVVDLSHNLLSGPIPQTIGEDMLNLKYLGLSNNDLNGSIPLSLCKMKQLAALDLSNNHLSGDVPNCWGYASNLKVPDFSNNNQSGGIAHSYASNIQVLDFSSNNLSGEIPDSVCSTQLLRFLDLHDNNLSGNIPPSLRTCEGLIVLDVSRNKLSGHIPTWMGKSLSSLKILRLQSNMFSGNIPSELSNLGALQILDLSHNNLSGYIPKSFGNFNAMKITHRFGDVLVNESYNGEGIGVLVEEYYYGKCMFLVVKGMEMEFHYKILSLFLSIDLSGNCLEGTIPDELGDLAALNNLNLSRNHLIGSIIRRIDRLNQLESLDLSRNELSGVIPSGLSFLTFLEHLNLSYNNLSGNIPSGNQLQTLDDPSIYIGNHDLCGFPLPKCQSAETPQVLAPEEEDDAEGSENLWFYIGMATGFVFGSWSLWGLFLHKKSWRVAFFHYVDDLLDNTYVTVLVNAKKLLGINLGSI